jgi:hypothetical protein
VSAWTEAELARKEDLVNRSVAGSSVSGTDAGVDLPRPRAGLMASTFRVEILGPRRRPRLGQTSPKVLLTPRVLRLPSTVQIRACRIGLSCSVCFLRPPRPKHTLAVL